MYVYCPIGGVAAGCFVLVRSVLARATMATDSGRPCIRGVCFVVAPTAERWPACILGLGVNLDGVCEKAMGNDCLSVYWAASLAVCSVQ